MHDEATTPPPSSPGSDGRRESTLRDALRKRDAGVPTLSVAEAAALLSVSREYLYKLIRAGAFPVLRMGPMSGPGRYVVPSRVVERLINAAATIRGGGTS